VKAFFFAVLLALTGKVTAQTSTLHIVEENGPRSQRINLVFFSEGYTAADLPSFAGHVNAARDFLFTREPWQQYRSYCNVYRIEIASNESGTDNGTGGGLRDTYFNSGFNTAGVPQLLTLTGNGNSRAYTLLNTHVPEYHVPVVIVNDTKYGGAGGAIATASIHSSSAAIVEHEVGHSFAGLADEYDANYPGYVPAEMPNNTAQTTRSLIRWNVWIDATTPIPTPETATYDNLVGLFEGSMYRTSGWYRPHNNSLMKNLFRPCGAVNREQFVLNYYARISPIDSASPPTTPRNVTAFEHLTFSVIPKIPSSGVGLAVSWKIDGAVQSGATAATFNPVSDLLGNGTHTVTAVVRDPTAFVRNDPSSLLDDSLTWTLTLSNQLPATLSAWRSTYGNDEANPAGDGLKNFLKYALGIDPGRHVATAQQPTTGLTTAGGSEKYLTLSIPRRTRRTDVDYVVEISGDLSDWHSGAGHTVIVEDLDNLLVVRDAQPWTANARRLLRLRTVERL
jgi:hypothetical protein